MLVKLRSGELVALVDDMKKEYGADFNEADVSAHVAVERLIAQVAFKCQDCALALVDFTNRTGATERHVNVSLMMGPIVAAVAFGGAHLCARWREGIEVEEAAPVPVDADGDPEILE